MRLSRCARNDLDKIAPHLVGQANHAMVRAGMPSQATRPTKKRSGDTRGEGKNRSTPNPKSFVAYRKFVCYYSARRTIRIDGGQAVDPCLLLAGAGKHGFLI